MATLQSSDEAQQEYLVRFGRKLGPVYQALVNEYWFMQLRWDQYQKLFATSANRVELANRAGGVFFRLVQDDFFENTLLSVARLTEGASGKRGRRNLTIQALPPLCPKRVRPRLQQLIDEAKSSAAFATDWRNRRLGHRDLQVVLGQAAPLAPATRAKVTASIRSIHAVLNFVGIERGRWELFDGAPDTAGPSVVTLLYYARKGLKAHANFAQRLRSGATTDGELDLEPI